MPKQKLHSWPTRRNPETGRYEVLLNGKWMSRQRAWQLRSVAWGCCEACGLPRLDRVKRNLCADCWQKKKFRFAMRTAA